MERLAIVPTTFGCIESVAVESCQVTVRNAAHSAALGGVFIITAILACLSACIAASQVEAGQSSIWKKNQLVFGECYASLNGKTIMNGPCRGLGHGDTVFVTSETNGCSIELAERGRIINGRIFAYRNECPNLENNTELGKFELEADCYRSKRARLCLYPESPPHAADDPPSPAQNYYGVMRGGRQTSAIGEAIFPTNSAIGRTILANCQDGMFCKLRATVNYKTHKLEKVVSIAPVPRFEMPTEMLEWIYDQYDDPGYSSGVRPQNYRDLLFIYTPFLAKLIFAELERAEKDQDVAFNAVWFQSQEGKPVRRRFKTIKLGPNRAETTVSYDISDFEEGPRQSVVFYSVKTSIGWRIDEAMYQLMTKAADTSWRKSLVKNAKGDFR